MDPNTPPSSAAGGNANLSSTSMDMDATMHAPLQTTSSSSMMESNQASAGGPAPTGQGLGPVNQQQPRIRVEAPLQSRPFTTPELVSDAGDSTFRSGDSSSSILRGMPIFNVPNIGTQASSSMLPNSYSISPAGQQIGSFFISSSPGPSPISRVAGGSSSNYYNSHGQANGYRPERFTQTSTPLPPHGSYVSHPTGQAQSYNYGAADGQTTGFTVFVPATPAPLPSHSTQLTQQSGQVSSHESTGIWASSGGVFNGSSPGPSSRATRSSPYYHNSHGRTTAYPVRFPLTSTPVPSRGSDVSNQATGQASSHNYGTARGQSTDFAILFAPPPATQPARASHSSQGQASSHQSPGVQISYPQQNRRNFFYPPAGSNPVRVFRGSGEMSCIPHPQQLGAAGGGRSALASNPPRMSFDGAVRMRCSERPTAGPGQGLPPSVFDCYRTFQATLAQRHSPVSGSSAQRSTPMQGTDGRQTSLHGRYTFTGSDHRVEDDVTIAGAGVGQHGSAQPEVVVDVRDPPAAATVQQQQRPSAGFAPAAASFTPAESTPVSSNTSRTAVAGSALAATPTTSSAAVGTGNGRPSSADQSNGGVTGQASASANDEGDHPRRSVITSRGQYSRRLQQHPQQQPQSQPQQPQPQPQQSQSQPQQQQQQPPMQGVNNHHAIPASYDPSRPYKYPDGVLSDLGFERIEQWVWSGYVSDGSAEGGARRVYFCGSCAEESYDTLEEAQRHANQVASRHVFTVSCFMCSAYFGTNEAACLAHMNNDHQIRFNNPPGNVEVDEDGLEPGEVRPPALQPPPSPSPSASSASAPTSPTDQQSPTFSD